MRILQRLIFVILAFLPIIDQLYKFEESSPAVMIRAGVFVLMCIILLFQLFRHNTIKVHPIVKQIILLMVYMAVVTVIADGGFQSAYTYIRVCFAFVGFFLVYYLTRNSMLDEKVFMMFFFVIIIIHGVLSYINIGYRLEGHRGLTIADNIGYTLVTLFSGVMLFTKKKSAFFITVFIVATGTLISGKRGAILVLFLSAIPLIRYVFTSYTRSGFRKIFIIFLVIIACSVALYMFGDYFNASFGRFDKLQEDGGSGRNDMYLLYLNNFWNSDTPYIIFGHGLYGSLWATGHRYAFVHLLAHNDWLQLLFDFGIIGAVLYLLMFVSIFRTIRRHRHAKDDNYYMLVIAFIVWGVKSMLSSTFLMTPNTIYLYMTVAYALGKLELTSQQVVLPIRPGTEQKQSLFSA